MKTVVAKLYEGMFLVDSALAASDFDGVNSAIRGILEKVGAEIISMKKWDERRLAYDIKGKSRGTYILTFFRADGSKIGDVERAVQLSEQIMRVLILNVEGMDQGYMDKETPAAATEQKSPAAATEQESPAAATEQESPAADAEQKSPTAATEQKSPAAEEPAEQTEVDSAEPTRSDENGLANDDPDGAQEQAEPDQKQQEQQ